MKFLKTILGTTLVLSPSIGTNTDYNTLEPWTISPYYMYFPNFAIEQNCKESKHFPTWLCRSVKGTILHTIFSHKRLDKLKQLDVDMSPLGSFVNNQIQNYMLTQLNFLRM